MRRFGWLLIPLLWLLAACSSGAPQLIQPTGVAAPGEEPAPTEAAATEAATVAADEAAAIAPSADDPTAARERDWKEGDLESPAVTIIEYGDFQ